MQVFRFIRWRIPGEYENTYSREEAIVVNIIIFAIFVFQSYIFPLVHQYSTLPVTEKT